MRSGGIRELALVMPVYNEEECIVDVVSAWREELLRLGIDFLMIIVNDGSRDGTRERLAPFAGDERIMVVNKENSGHGPTILVGYRMGVEEAEWCGGKRLFVHRGAFRLPDQLGDEPACRQRTGRHRDVRLFQTRRLQKQ